MNASVQDVLKFWFGNELTQRKEWFAKNDAFDEEIRSRFLTLHTQAMQGELESWTHEPESALALILILDQFSRNMFRGTPAAFASDGLALQVAKDAIAAQFDQPFPSVQRQFFYLPLEHSENLDDQDRSVALFERCDPSVYEYAIKHRSVIERFGRFPHRNAILGRESTAAELEFLKQPGSSF